jgi:predicted DCC family thiol-disulfide oxidoreductase YuxK
VKIVLFDGVCNLCNRSVLFIIRHDAKKQISFASLQSDLAKELLKQHGKEDYDLNSIIFIDENRLYLQSTAALMIAKYLDGGWFLLPLLMIIPKFIRDVCYRFIAKNRYKWFGKHESCLIPSKENNELFLT